jgi:hypothetical protein
MQNRKRERGRGREREGERRGEREREKKNCEFHTPKLSLLSLKIENLKHSKSLT